MTEILNTIGSETVEWLISWGGLNPDGTRVWPNKPEEEYVFETDRAIAHLLINEVIFTNTHWYKDDWPDDAKATFVLAVNCNDVFAWGVADSESINRGEIETLYRLWTKDPNWGGAAWCIHKRKHPPQKPVLDAMVKAGWDVDWLLNCSQEGILTTYRKGPTEVE